jgi:hypothetical protein
LLLADLLFFLKLKEASMPSENRDPRTFSDMVVVLLENRFPWLVHGGAVPLSGADTIDELSQLHHALLKQSAAPDAPNAQ